MAKKITFNTEAIVKRKNDILFTLVGLFLLFVCGYFFFDSLTFLTKSVDKALDEKDTAVSFQKFNLDGLKTLGILKPEHDATISPIMAATPAISPSSTTSSLLNAVE